VGVTTEMARTTGYNVLESGHLLRRYSYIERGLLRILAGWLPEVPQWEVKKAIGRHLWDEAEHADRLYQRLRELRGGHPKADADPRLVFLMGEALNAPEPAALLAGLYLTIKRHLLDAYQRHIPAASYVVDAPTVDLLCQIVQDEERHLEWAEEVLATLLQNEAIRRGASEWQQYLDRLVAAAGGLAGDLPATEEPNAPRPASFLPFKRSGRAQRDARFVIRPASEAYLPQAQMDGLPLRENEIAAFRLYFSEMWAAELVASVIFDAEDMPWEFYHDLARHCWDEIRHCEMGEMRLKELGIGISDYPVAVSEYERCVRMPWAHRYCDLTMMAEARHIHVRPPRVKRWTEEGARRSAMFADYDWSDEINHVAYGYKWLRHLLENDARTIDDLVAECEVMRQRLAEEASEFRLPAYAND